MAGRAARSARYGDEVGTSAGAPTLASLLVRPPTRSSSSVPPSESADSLLNPKAVAYELLQGLMARDPVSPRVSLATVRALRRAEQGHVDRVTAAVQACLEYNRRTGTCEGDPRVLADLAAFERHATERLLARTAAGVEPVSGQPDSSRSTPAPSPDAATDASPAPTRARSALRRYRSRVP